MCTITLRSFNWELLLSLKYIGNILMSKEFLSSKYLETLTKQSVIKKLITIFNALLIFGAQLCSDCVLSKNVTHTCIQKSMFVFCGNHQSCPFLSLAIVLCTASCFYLVGKFVGVFDEILFTCRKCIFSRLH